MESEFKRLPMNERRRKRLAEIWSDFLGRKLTSAEVEQMLRMVDVVSVRSQPGESELKEPSEVSQFWGLVGRIGVSRLDHSIDPDVVAINLPHFWNLCQQQGLTAPSLRVLKRKLRYSTQLVLLDKSRVVYSGIDSKNYRCWVFRKKREA